LKVYDGKEHGISYNTIFQNYVDESLSKAASAKLASLGLADYGTSDSSLPELVQKDLEKVALNEGALKLFKEKVKTLNEAQLSVIEAIVTDMENGKQLRLHLGGMGGTGILRTFTFIYLYHGYTLANSHD
jgi:hypothetical protein